MIVIFWFVRVKKLDSLMRSKSEVLRRVSVVVADEFHLLNDNHRGPTMEINLARVRHLLPMLKSLHYQQQLEILKIWRIGLTVNLSSFSMEAC